jgi:WD40 repeat protein
LVFTHPNKDNLTCRAATRFRVPGYAAVWSDNSVSYSQDGTFLAVAKGNNHTYLWNLATGEVTGLADPKTGGTGSAVFSPVSTTLTIADGNGNIYLRNPATGRDTAKSHSRSLK